MQFYKMIFNYDKIAKSWGTGGLVGALKDTFTKAFTKLNVSDEVSKFFSGKDLDAKLFGKDGVLAGKGFQ